MKPSEMIKKRIEYNEDFYEQLYSQLGDSFYRDWKDQEEMDNFFIYCITIIEREELDKNNPEFEYMFRRIRGEA